MTTTARAAVAGIVLLGAVVLVIVLTSGAGGYRIDAQFANAGQLVKGNIVSVAGEPVGTVEDLRLGDDGQAVAQLSIREDHAPLRRGTRAVIRKRSLSSAAGDYVDLQLGQGGADEIGDGGTIPGVDTESDVPLDAVFNTFDPVARVAVGDSIRFLRDTTRGREARANAALKYLSPALSSSSALLTQLDRNRPDLERFVTATAGLVTDLSARDDALAGVVSNLSATMRALGAERAGLGEAVTRLPLFLRQTNTTFVNLRAALDDLDPLVTAATPVVRDRLRPLFAQLRPFATDARPTVRDLSRTIRRPGTDNDLVELLRRQPAVDAIANRTARRNGADRPGALKALQAALKGATPQLAFARPYSVDAVGWFDDFSASGGDDALGGYSRAGLGLNQFSFAPALNALVSVPPALRPLLNAGLATGRNDRCPGSIERAAPDGSNPFKPTPDFNCDLTQVPVGP